MTTREIIECIEEVAKAHGVSPSLATAIAGHESNFDPARTRYEPSWNYLERPEAYAKLLGITTLTEVQLQRFSWGVMQVMGSVAREQGFQDQLTNLIEPELGIFYGVKKLKSLSHTYASELDVISSYNQGSPNKLNGVYLNKNYVDNIENRLKLLRSI